MFKISDEGPLPGLADLVTISEKDLGDDLAIAECTRQLAESDLPVGVTMSLIPDLRGFIERILFRRLVRELPTQVRRLPWFECHVPPGGATKIASSATTSRSGSIELKVFGAGLGRGRKTSITVSSASEPRTSCATFALDVQTTPRIFDVRGVESVEVEVTAVLGESVIDNQRCPYCGVARIDVDPFDFVLGEYLDFREDRVETTRGYKVEIEDNASIEMGLDIESVQTKCKLGAESVGHSVFEFESRFPAGLLYQPYRRLSGTTLQTPMWAIERARA